MIDERLNGRFLSERGRLRQAVLTRAADACGCTACVGSGVMCRVIARYFTKRRFR